MKEDWYVIHRQIDTILNSAEFEMAAVIRLLALVQIFIDRHASAWPADRVERFELAVQKVIELRRESRDVPETIKTEIRSAFFDG